MLLTEVLVLVGGVRRGLSGGSSRRVLDATSSPGALRLEPDQLRLDLAGEGLEPPKADSEVDLCAKDPLELRLTAPEGYQAHAWRYVHPEGDADVSSA